MLSRRQALWVLGAACASYGCQPTQHETHSAGVETQQQADAKLIAARNQVEGADDAGPGPEKLGVHNEARTWAQDKLDTVDHLIEAARAKARAAAPQAQTRFKAAMQNVRRQRNALRAEMVGLETRAGDKLDKSKLQFDQGVARIKASLENIEQSR